MRASVADIQEVPQSSSGVALFVEDLRVALEPSGIDIDDEVTLTIHEGEVVGLVGESACGKTTVATSLLAQQRRGAKILVGGHITVEGPLMCFRRLPPAEAAVHPPWGSDLLRPTGRFNLAKSRTAHQDATHGDPRMALIWGTRAKNATPACRRHVGRGHAAQ